MIFTLLLFTTTPSGILIKDRVAGFTTKADCVAAGEKATEASPKTRYYCANGDVK